MKKSHQIRYFRCKRFERLRKKAFNFKSNVSTIPPAAKSFYQLKDLEVVINKKKYENKIEKKDTLNIERIPKEPNKKNKENSTEKAINK